MMLSVPLVVLFVFFRHRRLLEGATSASVLVEAALLLIAPMSRTGGQPATAAAEYQHRCPTRLSSELLSLLARHLPIDIWKPSAGVCG